jgi:hypothetical protein
MALGSTGAISLGGPSTGQSIALELGLSATATISLNDTVVRTLGGVASGEISLNNFFGKSNTPAGTQKAIFAFGQGTGSTPGSYNVPSVIISSSGTIASQASLVGTGRRFSASATYGGDKAIFGWGEAPTIVSVSNLVSNTGVVATDTPGVGTARQSFAAAGYGNDKAIFGFGSAASPISRTNISNLVSNTGVVSTDTPGVGTARDQSSALTYGGDKAIFAFGGPSLVGVPSNLVSNTGVVASDTPIIGSTQKAALAATSYGDDKGLMTNRATYNLISNTGVVASDVSVSPGVGPASSNNSGANYGGDKGFLMFGASPTFSPSTLIPFYNLVSNTGVIASSTPVTGATLRYRSSGAGFSSTA